ncbi:MAG TPA: sugar ABC transporter permease [Clostridia bacterium]|nr:sugar ABC transporter permease [Clostridia bacterium]HOR12482.1 sugar ABC transporter permease [Clostridia bacterium]
MADKRTIKTKHLEEKSFTAALADIIKNNMRQYTMIIALLLIWSIFTLLTKGVFIRPRNLSNLFLQMCTIGLLTGGMLLVMVSGNIDLSVGSVCGTLGAIVAYLMTRAGLHPIIAILITIGCGTLVGCWQGFWVAYRGVPAFIVTLASQIAFRGLTLLVTNGATIGEFDPGFKIIGQGYIPRLFFKDAPLHDLTMLLTLIAMVAFVFIEVRRRRKRIAKGFAVLPKSMQLIKLILILAAIGGVGTVLGSYMGAPYAILILLAVVGVFWVITTRTPFGRHVYAIGGNREAARLSGINVKKEMMKIFIIAGTVSAVASIVFTARINAATTSAGMLFESDTIAACIIGGTSTSGGVGSVFGAIIGALVMASLDNGMSLMNLPIMIQYMVKGLILLVAVWIDIANRTKK